MQEAGFPPSSRFHEVFTSALDILHSIFCGSFFNFYESFREATKDQPKKIPCCVPVEHGVQDHFRICGEYLASRENGSSMSGHSQEER
jgi:hypothetical protein